MKIRFSSLIVLFSVLLIGVEAAQAQLVISEILAVNDTVVQDEDGDYSDFLEVFNAGPTAVNLGGYYLTDDALELTKWEIPDMVLPSGGFALFFCSDKDRIDPSAELHTNFKLLSTGEYLAIVDPDGQTPVFEFDPYPPQVADFSYGLRMNGEEIRFVRERDDCTALVPSNGNLGLTWTAWDFNDNSWESGETGVGYDRNSDYDSNIRLDIQNEMEDENTTTYIRVPFEVDDASGVGSFTLRMKYDDGFIAYLNGDRVASANAPGAASWNSTATTLHDDGEAVQFVDFPFSSNALRNGTNVLAIHGLNDNLGSSDFLISPELRGQVAGELQLDVREYQPSPTPGGANVGGFPGIAETPVFSTPGSVFTGSVSLRLTTTSPESVIRYTTDGSEPNESDSIANGAINITNTTLVRARSFREDYSPSPIVTQGYVELASSAANFSSNLPIVVIENFDEGEPGTSRFEPAFMAIFMPGQDGRTRFDQPPVLQTRIGIKRRGSSTAGQPKGQYAIEAWDEKGEDTNIEPFGLPREADWILYGGNTYDRAIIRNKFIFDTSNALGTYAPRSELVEIFFNTGGGSVSSGDNVGVYAFGEKIERDNNRVDVERLTASIDSLPEIAGGYMFKIDRLDPGD
ncbi:MAG: chitobiase/beta-hexosaminidase C-terminal domain-containing protein, partial [Planctomycetota bacterium]